MECKYLLLAGVTCDASAHPSPHFVAGGHESQKQEHDDGSKNTDIRETKNIQLYKNP